MIQIKKLTPELIEDYLYYFDHVAFEDNHEWSQCYCIFYYWNDELEAQSKSYVPKEGSCHGREVAVEYIREGRLTGYLAYKDDEVVGWCNTGDKGNYDRLNSVKRPELWEDTDPSDKVKSIVCFSIAPDMRRKGVASTLLDRICADAAIEGYAYVEAYPGLNPADMIRNYHGPYAIYEKGGFEMIRNLGDEAIVRKYV